MKTYVLEREQVICRSKSETFEFFSDAFNLECITPPFLKFKILTRHPVDMATGTLIDYKLALYGISLKWRTLIESWEPDARFVDSQIKGPYLLWHHTHIFEEIGPERTLVKDIVRYQMPFGILGQLAHRLFVKRMLDKIFDYRAKMTAQ